MKVMSNEKKKILLPLRTDQLGANVCSKMAVFFYGKKNNYEVIYSKDSAYMESMFMIPLLKNSRKMENNETGIIVYDENTQEANFRVLNGKAVCSLNNDLISYFSKKYKKNFFGLIKKKAEERNYKLPWNNKKNIICIHLRLYDGNSHEGANNSDYDGSYSTNYILNLLENNKIEYFNKREMYKICKRNGFVVPIGSEPSLCDRQTAINIVKLEKLILLLKNKYPEKEIHVVTKLSENKENQKYVNLCNHYKIPIHTNNDYDYDLWLLINSEILILSKSTYSLLAGYYHQGSKIIYPLWGHFACLGLGSKKYDNSNWVSYI